MSVIYTVRSAVPRPASVRAAVWVSDVLLSATLSTSRGVGEVREKERVLEPSMGNSEHGRGVGGGGGRGCP